MITKSSRTLLFLLFFGFFGYAFSGDVSTGDDKSTEDNATSGDDATSGDEEKTGDEAMADEAMADEAKADEAMAEEATAEDETTGDDVLAGDKEAGEARYNKTCKNCHGPAGKGVASYPKISGNDISYTTSKLETYRAGTKIGPNSSLMIMMARPLTDEEIANIANYLKDAHY